MAMLWRERRRGRPASNQADGGSWGKRLWRGSRPLARHLRGLPPRIQTLVDAELQRADILGAWVVFAVAAFLGSLYLAAPKALDSMGTLYTVPAIVGFILLLSLVRLRMAYRAPLGRTAQIGLHRGRFGDRLRHRVDGLLVAALRLGKISEVLALHPLPTAEIAEIAEMGAGRAEMAISAIPAIPAPPLEDWK
jgi:hypothetical protein